MFVALPRKMLNDSAHLTISFSLLIPQKMLNNGAHLTVSFSLLIVHKLFGCFTEVQLMLCKVTTQRGYEGLCRHLVNDVPEVLP